MESDKILRIIELLKKEESALVIVEGERDLKALRILGINHPIRKISGRRIFDEQFQKRDIIILTDFDRKGRILFNQLRNELEVMGLHPNVYYWQTLKEMLKGEIKGIEELSQFAEE